MRMGKDVGTNEERSLYYKFKKKKTQSLNKKKTLKPRPNYRAFKTVKVYIMLAALMSGRSSTRQFPSWKSGGQGRTKSNVLGTSSSYIATT